MEKPPIFPELAGERRIVRYPVAPSITGMVYFTRNLKFLSLKLTKASRRKDIKITENEVFSEYPPKRKPKIHKKV